MHVRWACTHLLHLPVTALYSTTVTSVPDADAASEARGQAVSDGDVASGGELAAQVDAAGGDGAGSGAASGATEVQMIDGNPLPRVNSFYSRAYSTFLSRSNPADVMHRVAIPLIFISAKDDPVCSSSNIPTGDAAAEVVENENIGLVITKRGR